MLFGNNPRKPAMMARDFFSHESVYGDLTAYAPANENACPSESGCPATSADGRGVEED